MPPLHTVRLPASGPEDVAVDGSGHVFTGTADGRILRVDTAGGDVTAVAATGGRPLGIEVLDDALLVCDADRGLLRVDPAEGRVDVLCRDAGGVPLTFCNNAAVAADGTIFFTDSSQRFSLEHWRADIVEHSGTGRLIRLSPDGDATVILDGLQFANGVALAADESYVAVAETGSYRVQQVWLSGDRAGTTGVLVDNLPGFPDNMATGSDGLIWIALASRRNPLLDWLHKQPPVIRRVLWTVPEQLQPGPQRTAWVLAVNAAGEVVHDVQRTDPDFHFATGVREADGRVYMGSLLTSTLAWFDLETP